MFLILPTIVIVLYALSRRRFVAASLVVIACGSFMADAYFDRRNFFSEVKMKHALDIGLSKILDRRRLESMSAADFMLQNPNCCLVSQYINGSAPVTDNRSLLQVTDDKISSLFNFDRYVVFVYFSRDGTTDTIDVTGGGGVDNSSYSSSKKVLN
jgi:hypothetical protein